MNQPLDDLADAAAGYGFNGNVSDKLSPELLDLLSEEFGKSPVTQPAAPSPASSPTSGKPGDFSLPELWDNDPSALSGGLTRSRLQVARLEGTVEALEFLQQKDAAFEETIFNYSVARRRQLDASSASLIQRWQDLISNSQGFDKSRQNQELAAIQHGQKLEAEFATLSSQEQKLFSPKK